MVEKGRDQRSLVASDAMISGDRKREAKAFGRYLHISPTKVQDLLRLVRGKAVSEAETILKFSGRKGGEAALKVLRSAEANAGSEFEKSQWTIADAQANKGPLYRRRVSPRARGSGNVLRSPSTHITVVIREKKTVKSSSPRSPFLAKSKANEQMINKPMEKSATERSGDGPQA